MDKKQKNETDAFVIEAIARREQLESDGITCRHEKQQPIKSPEFNENFIGTEIEQLWNFIENNGTQKPIWCKGTVVSVSSNKKR